MRFLLFRATKMTQMTSVPTSLTAKKTMNMKFFSKISRPNVPVDRTTSPIILTGHI